MPPFFPSPFLWKPSLVFGFRSRRSSRVNNIFQSYFNLPPIITREISEYDNVGQSFLDEFYISKLADYYRQPLNEILHKYINQEILTLSEHQRLLHEAGPNERQILEQNDHLQDDLVQGISRKYSVSVGKDRIFL